LFHNLYIKNRVKYPQRRTRKIESSRIGEIELSLKFVDYLRKRGENGDRIDSLGKLDGN
jgi:hypothetical protein